MERNGGLGNTLQDLHHFLIDIGYSISEQHVVGNLLQLCENGLVVLELVNDVLFVVVHTHRPNFENVPDNLSLGEVDDSFGPLAIPFVLLLHVFFDEEFEFGVIKEGV